MKAYLDQNVWEHVIHKFSVTKFKQKLESNQIELCLGTHNIYEFARCFLDENNSKNIEKGKEIFQYLSDLDIAYFLNQIEQLIDSDLVYALTGGKLLPFLDNYSIAAAKEEMLRLAKGYSGRARNFIHDREDGLAKDTPEYRKAIIEGNINMPKLKDFYEFRDNWEYRRDVLRKSEYWEKTKFLSDEKLFSEPGKYPYLNTWINAQLYFNFIALTNPEGPSKKSTSDYRHLINANAADFLVTEDQRIQQNSQKLCPYNRIYSWDEFEEMLRKD